MAEPAEYDADDNAYRGWQFALAVLRERGVRAGIYPPKDAQEACQREEGPVPNDRLDAMGDSACG